MIYSPDSAVSYLLVVNLNVCMKYTTPYLKYLLLQCTEIAPHRNSVIFISRRVTTTVRAVNA